MTMTPLLGLDVSNYQGSLDFSALQRAYGLSFCFAKATESHNFTDPYFAASWPHITAAKMVRGAYHFARPGSSDARIQADFFLSVVQRAGLRPEDKLILDLESTIISASATNQWAKDWADRVYSETGHKPIIYTSGYMLNSTGLGFKDHFSAWWYANYPNAYVNSTLYPMNIMRVGAPASNWPRVIPDIWQFTSTFHGTFDASIFTGTADQLISLGYPNGAQPDMPSLNSDDLAAITKIVNGAWYYDQSANPNYVNPLTVIERTLDATTRIEAAIATLASPTIDAQALADAIVAKLPASQVDALLNALAARLAS